MKDLSIITNKEGTRMNKDRGVFQKIQKVEKNMFWIRRQIKTLTSSFDIQILKEKIHKNADSENFQKYLACKIWGYKEKIVT